MNEFLDNQAAITLYQYGAIGAITVVCIVSLLFLFIYILRNKDKRIDFLENRIEEEVAKKEELLITFSEQIREDNLKNVEAIISINTTLKNIRNEQFERRIK